MQENCTYGSVRGSDIPSRRNIVKGESSCLLDEMSGMADVLQKIRMLKMFRLNPDKFLPVVDHAWKVFPDKDMGTEWYDDQFYSRRNIFEQPRFRGRLFLE